MSANQVLCSNLLSLLAVALFGCNGVGQIGDVKENKVEKGRVIEGLREGPWFIFSNDSLEEANYYYNGQLQFGLNATDFQFANHCSDTLKFCWKYPVNWKLENQLNGIMSWVDSSWNGVEGASSPVATVASVKIPSETAETIGNYLVSTGINAINTDADSLSILEDRMLSTLIPGTFTYKLSCIFYKEGNCYGLCRVIVCTEGEALILSGTASCNEDTFVKKLSVFVEMASSITLLNETVLDYDNVWKE